MINNPSRWRHSINSGSGEYEEEDEEEDDEDRTVDLLIRFVNNMFKKLSKRARKAVRSVLPFSISTHLVKLILQGPKPILLIFIYLSIIWIQIVEFFVVLFAIKVILIGNFYFF